MKLIIKRPEIYNKNEIYALFDTVIRHTFEHEDIDGEYELIGELIADQQALIDAHFDSSEKVDFLVAQIDSKIVGTICHRPCSDIIRACADRETTGVHEIGSIYILPEQQGMGIAKLLLNAMYKKMIAKGFSAFWLDSGYTIAKQVWQGILGKPTIIMKDYWGKGYDHHLWYRRFDELNIKK